MDGSLHRLDPNDSYVKFILCYPYLECGFFEDRLTLLKERGFTHLVEKGFLFLKYRILGKGYSSISVLSVNDHYGLGFLKIRRLDSRRGSLEMEGFFLDYFEKFGFVPRVFNYTREFVFMTYLEDCTPLDEIVRGAQRGAYGMEHLMRVFSKTLYSLHIADLHGVDHTELNRPTGHIYLCVDNVKIIDWESATLRPKPSNVSSLISYILFRSPLTGRVSSKVRDEVLGLVREYKRKLSIKILREIIKLLEESLV